MWEGYRPPTRMFGGLTPRSRLGRIVGAGTSHSSLESSFILSAALFGRCHGEVCQTLSHWMLIPLCIGVSVGARTLTRQIDTDR